MSNVLVKPELFRWARERSGLDTSDLTHRFPKYEAWESGEVKPTLRQLEDLARMTLTPLGYFFLPEPPDEKLPIPDFRTLRDQPLKRPSPNLLETIEMMQRRQAWMRDFLIEQGEKPLSFVGVSTVRSDVIAVAAHMREVLGLTRDWARKHSTWTDALRALRGAVEEAGVMVVINGVVGNNNTRKLDPNEFRGFVLSDNYAPLVFVNGSDGKAAQMFTLAHEVVHVWINREGVFNLPQMLPIDDAVETFCNRVAAEFLIPAVELQKCWPDAERTSEPFQTIAARFKVSPLVAARRALDLSLINKAVFFDFYNAYQEDERRKSAKKPPGGDFYATQDVRIGKRFAHAVIRAAKDGRVLYRDAYQLTGLFGQTFDRYAKALGIQFEA